MTYYEIIYEHAADNFGLITSSEARGLDIPNVELVKLSHRGRLKRLGHGVYRIAHYIPSQYDKYAEAVAIVGENAFIFRESVLAMHGLALVNPTTISVATINRIRKTLPTYIKLFYVREDHCAVTSYEGIQSQSVLSALLACRGIIMTDRLESAVDEARRNGLITQAEAERAREELHNERQSAK